MIHRYIPLLLTMFCLIHTGVPLHADQPDLEIHVDASKYLHLEDSTDPVILQAKTGLANAGLTLKLIPQQIGMIAEFKGEDLRMAGYMTAPDLNPESLVRLAGLLGLKVQKSPDDTGEIHFSGPYGINFFARASGSVFLLYPPGSEWLEDETSRRQLWARFRRGMGNEAVRGRIHAGPALCQALRTIAHVGLFKAVSDQDDPEAIISYLQDVRFVIGDDGIRVRFLLPTYLLDDELGQRVEEMRKELVSSLERNRKQMQIQQQRGKASGTPSADLEMMVSVSSFWEHFLKQVRVGLEPGELCLTVQASVLTMVVANDWFHAPPPVLTAKDPVPATPVGSSSRKDKARESCRENQKVLESAYDFYCYEKAVIPRHGVSYRSLPIDDYLKTWPVCPAGGEYITELYGRNCTPRCSVHGLISD